MTRREELKSWADHCNLLVCTYSPGDGVTRYRFFRRADVPESQTYFGPKSGLDTVLGFQAAVNWMRAYSAGIASTVIRAF